MAYRNPMNLISSGSTVFTHFCVLRAVNLFQVLSMRHIIAYILIREHCFSNIWNIFLDTLCTKQKQTSNEVHSCSTYL